MTTTEDNFTFIPQNYLPPKGMSWNGNWKIGGLKDGQGGGGGGDQRPNAGEYDDDGWEYATTASRMTPHRVPRVCIFCIEIWKKYGRFYLFKMSAQWMRMRASVFM